MGMKAKPKDYRLVELRPDGRPAVRLLIYRTDGDKYIRLISRHVSLEDLTGDSLQEEALDEVDALLIWKCPYTVLNSLTNLKWIQTTSAGIDQILDYLRERPETIVTTTKGMSTELISNYVLMTMLAFQWRLPTLLQRQQDHLWELVPTQPLSGLTCALVGVGNIGGRIAQCVQELGMTVLGCKLRPQQVDHVDRMFEPDQLGEMLQLADFVVLTLPLTKETRGLIGATEFEMMKPGAYLIQVSRGGIVDEKALLNALESKQIAGAAVDVVEQEPLPHDHPLWDAPNVIVTPHVSGERVDHSDAVTQIFIHNLMAYPDVMRMQGLADTRLGY